MVEHGRRLGWQINTVKVLEGMDYDRHTQFDATTLSCAFELSSRNNEAPVVVLINILL